MQERVNKVFFGNCLDVLPTLESNSVDSIITDAPYELGFMGKSWDNTGIANNIEMWRECLRVLKPGGHLLAFSGTRTYHRMAVAIEDAGFEVRDMIEWVYGSGFPKSLNIGKAVSKLMGEEVKQGTAFKTAGEYGGRNLKDPTPINEREQFRHKPQTEEGKKWEGWGTALKPAHEPICMARKPLSEKTVAENCLKWGTGGINIDESRVENTGKSTLRPLGKSAYQKGGGIVNGGVAGTHEVENEFGGGHDGGRFPANLIHDNSEEVRECFPNESERFFKSISTISDPIQEWAEKEVVEHREEILDEMKKEYGFIKGKSIIYQAKASKSERNKGLDVIEEDNKRPQGEAFGDGSAITEHSERKGNNHPTVKPIALMEYLIKMVTPKGGIVLDPFAGSGSTLVAAKQNGYQYIGIEMTEEYIPIIEARLNATICIDETKK